MLTSSLLLTPLIFTGVNAIPSRTVYYHSGGCGKAPPGDVSPGISINQTIDSQSGASPRKYRIHLPESYQNNVSVPLILSYHGRSRDSKYQEILSQFSNSSYGFEGISVYPEGVPFGPRNTKQWEGDPDSHNISDTIFTIELIQYLSEAYCIDPNRIYATGKSNGGGFTNVLACDPTTSGLIAAFAPVSGAFYLENKTQELPPCTPAESRSVIPILDFHGWLDDTIPYLGGINQRQNANSTNIVKYVDEWAKRNSFEVNANVTTTLCGEDKKVTRYAWDNTVVHYNLSNLEHDWPSSFPNLDTNLTTCREAEATKVILDWFRGWSLLGARDGGRVAKV
ncbi:hypothetical protein B0J11DRAFT_347325 [Dendryphion nanum]|uniref:feruloyl esterase n=1 Tax=Dendryphion nanum TaxID=256645 RepID=A0A9P9DNM1_9PLEO|nr:hypothetical protein B0J11DRAFT_347325 [Dendryphion nanum]